MKSYKYVTALGCIIVDEAVSGGNTPAGKSVDSQLPEIITQLLYNYNNWYNIFYCSIA